jgi:hypothetical protein
MEFVPFASYVAFAPFATVPHKQKRIRGWAFGVSSTTTYVFSVRIQQCPIKTKKPVARPLEFGEQQPNVPVAGPLEFGKRQPNIPVARPEIWALCASFVEFCVVP